MNLLNPSIAILVGFAFLILGGEWLVRSAVNFAHRLKVSTGTIALTIIAAGTSLPELVTSLLAAHRGAPDIAVGNVVGSNIFNLLAVIGITSLIRPSVVPPAAWKAHWPFLMTISVILAFLMGNALLNRMEGLLLFVALLGYMFLSVFYSRKKEGSSESQVKGSLLKDFIFLTLGFVFLLGGAHTALEGAVSLGRFFGLSERIIGITIISVGTGLPELTTAVIAAYRKQDEIAIGTILGSSAFNILGILGLTALIHPIHISPKIIHFDIWFMVGATAVLFPMLKQKSGIISAMQGLLLTSLYVGYIFVLFHF